MQIYIGFSHLEEQFKLRPVQPLTTACKITNARTSVERNGFRVETYTKVYEPEDTTKGHFEFGLKYEDLNFEWLSRFFEKVPSDWIVQWLEAQPNSSYARRTAFFYEWFTSKRLPLEDTTAPTFTHALDSTMYLVATESKKSRRWRILDNMPGTPAYCPLVRITPELKSAAEFDLSGELTKLDNKFGADLLLRSAAWLTFNESRATFTIEKESDKKDQIKRFASAMQNYCGSDKKLICNEVLVALQNEILGENALRRGIRKSPVFVGTSAKFDMTVVHYIAPEFEALPFLMEGLAAFDDLTASSGEEPTNNFRSILRAGVISFGFVYIHPMSDGNGRIHRLLVNDTLMRDGRVPKGIILPVSSTIAKSSTIRGEYQKTLESISAKQVAKYATNYSFGKMRYCDDGVSTDFNFNAYEDAMHHWQYPDLTAHCIHLAHILKVTVVENMTEEASFLADHDEAKRELKWLVEMPENDADRIVRSLRTNAGSVSKKLLDTYPEIFNNPELSAKVTIAVNTALRLLGTTEDTNAGGDDPPIG